MKTPLAWRNLVHNKPRTAAAVAGVAFSVVLIFMQLGFLGAVESTATVLLNALDFDVLIRSRHYLHTADAESFPRNRLIAAQAVPGVKDAKPMHLSFDQWRHPRTGRLRAILMMGVDPLQSPFRAAEIRAKLPMLTRSDLLLVDRESRPEFGPARGRRFSDADIGTQTELGGRRVQIAGHFSMGTGLAADGAVLVSEPGFVRLAPGRRADEVSLGLIRVAAGDSAQEVAARLRAALPPDVEVLTRDEALRFERNRWVWETSIGLIFQTGVLVGMAVGVAIVYQVLASDVAGRLPEYATLRCMGYSHRFLAGVVLRQALALAMAGYVPGLVLSLILYQVTSMFAYVQLTMTPQRIALVLGLTLLMCSLAGIVAVRKLRGADPVELF